ncbi:MAG TPA: TIGR03620 family F420-dependent LLM class oxidoreductase [Acidimicrobiales bacterium]|nr:TIGR03620 family F420-dependent LLM class oxidoreductase [Acidimicrobiales bacterium]
MAKIDLGPIGVALAPLDDSLLPSVAALEEQGYPTVWITGGPLAGLEQVVAAVDATERIRVATGILSVDRFDADAVTALYADLEDRHPGRLVVGLGGAHGARPLGTLGAYLDRLDAPGGVPEDRRVLAALGPRMLDLARDRSSGAFPVLVTPGYTRDARARLGDGTTLAVEQMVLVEPDPATARAQARERLGFLASLPQYQASFRRMGFAEDDIQNLGDPLIDGLVTWGDIDAVEAGVRAHLDAGADHVAISVVGGATDPPVGEWRALAERLL